MQGDDHDDNADVYNDGLWPSVMWTQRLHVDDDDDEDGGGVDADDDDGGQDDDDDDDDDDDVGDDDDGQVDAVPAADVTWWREGEQIGNRDEFLLGDNQSL